MFTDRVLGIPKHHRHDTSCWRPWSQFLGNKKSSVSTASSVICPPVCPLPGHPSCRRLVEPKVVTHYWIPWPIANVYCLWHFCSSNSSILQNHDSDFFQVLINGVCWVASQVLCINHTFPAFLQYFYLLTYEVWSKTMVNAAAKRNPMERQGSSIQEAARRTLVAVCDKFQLVRCSKSVVSYGWENVCFKVCHKSLIMNNALIWNFVSNCKEVVKKFTKC